MDAAAGNAKINREASTELKRCLQELHTSWIKRNGKESSTTKCPDRKREWALTLTKIESDTERIVDEWNSETRPKADILNV